LEWKGSVIQVAGKVIGRDNKNGTYELGTKT
jgi:hypothetical protein